MGAGVGTFPSDFEFGIADSDLQVIGEKHTFKEEQSEPSMWRHYALSSGKCFQNATPDEGCDRYHRWREDLQLIQDLGVTCYRTSVSMCRVLQRNGEPNRKALQWYRDYFKAIKEAGLKLVVTLYHWELPQFLSEKGGWKNRETCDWLRRHARYVAAELGEWIDEYFILNEPWCSSMLGHHQGAHAPGETDLKSALSAAHHLLLAQGAVLADLKSAGSELKVSAVVNVEPAYGASLSEEDLAAARYAEGYFHQWFLDPLFKGCYPEQMLELYGERMPRIEEGDLEQIAIGSKLHALGINFYNGCLAEYDAAAEKRYRSVKVAGEKENDLGGPIFIPPHYPEALYDFLQQCYFEYRSYGLKRIYLSENGTALRSSVSRGGEIDDQPRIDYLCAHLDQVLQALKRGIPVERYFVWTLLDNYEWADGYRPESAFGLVHVDRGTLKRRPKRSYAWYRGVCRSKSF
jgi:beta-glucosidase